MARIGPHLHKKNKTIGKSSDGRLETRLGAMRISFKRRDVLQCGRNSADFVENR